MTSCYELFKTGKTGTEARKMTEKEMKTVEVQIPKNAITVRIVGVVTVDGGIGLETYEINRDDLCNADWGDDDVIR